MLVRGATALHTGSPAHMLCSGAAGRQQPAQRCDGPALLDSVLVCYSSGSSAQVFLHPRRPDPSEGAQLLPGSCATSDAAKASRWPVTEDSRWSLFGKNIYYTFSR